MAQVMQSERPSSSNTLNNHNNFQHLQKKKAQVEIQIEEDHNSSSQITIKQPDDEKIQETHSEAISNQRSFPNSQDKAEIQTTTELSPSKLENARAIWQINRFSSQSRPLVKIPLTYRCVLAEVIAGAVCCICCGWMGLYILRQSHPEYVERKLLHAHWIAFFSIIMGSFCWILIISIILIMYVNRESRLS